MANGNFSNIGDAFLSGFQGVAALRQQRYDNALNTRKLDQVDTQLELEDRRIETLEGDLKLKVDAAAKTGVIAGNDQWIHTANAAGLLSKDRLSLNSEAMRKGIANGDMTVTKVALDLVNGSGQLPEGSLAESLQPLPNGGYAITVRNADGSSGAVTEDGESETGSRVVNFEEGKLVNIGNLHYQKNVVSNSSIFDPSQMRAQLNRVESDAERNELLTKYEAIIQASQVLDKVGQSGDVGAVRGIVGVLASADGEEASNQILSQVSQDIGVEDKVGQQAIDDGMGGPPQTGPASAPTLADDDPRTDKNQKPSSIFSRSLIQTPTGIAQSSVDDTFEYLRGKELMEGGLDKKLTDLQAKEDQIRQDMVDGTIPVSIGEKKLGKISNKREQQVALANRASARDIKRMEVRRDALRKRGMDKEADQVQQKLNAEIGRSYSNQGIADIAAQVEGKTGDEIDDAVEKGEIKVTSEASREVAQTMKDEGIEELAGLLRLNDRDRAIARAVLISSTTDEVTRRALSDEINNIFETDAGQASYTVAEQEDDATNRGTNRINFRKVQNAAAQWGVAQYETATARAVAFTKSVNAVFYPEEGKTNLDKSSVKHVARTFVPEMLMHIDAATSVQDRNVQMKALGGVLSSMMAALAGEENNTIREKIISFFRPDAKNSVQATDFDLSRVRPITKTVTKNGVETEVVTEYEYLDPFGNVTDTRIKAGTVAAVDQDIEKLIRKAVLANQKKIEK